MKTEVVDRLPEEARGRGRTSSLASLIELARSAAPKYVRVTADTDDEVGRLYRATMAWRDRHPADGLMVRKVRDAFFVWFEESGADPE